METGKIDFKKYNKSTLGLKQKSVHLSDLDRYIPSNVDNQRLLEKCRVYWDSLDDFRTRRERNREYYRGNQWGDLIKDPDSNITEYITEETYIKRQGKLPFKNNQIRQLVKNLIGQFRINPTKSVIFARAREEAEVSEMLTIALNACKTANKADDLDARIFEEFALSGAPIQKVTFRFWQHRNTQDGYLENVNPNRIFFNSDVADVRLHDLNLIGEIIDTTLDDIVSTFAQNKADEQKIRDIYRSHIVDNVTDLNGLSSKRLDNLNFYVPHDSGKARMYEVWRQIGEWVVRVHDPIDASFRVVDYSMKDVARLNMERLALALEQGIPEEEVPLLEADETYEKFWHVKFLTPSGHTLWEGRSPYKHGSHPYALTLYPLLDGEVWGFVEDILDQQRYINRLIILMDFIMSASAKGVLMIPEDAIPDNMTEADFADEWVKFNGVITYKPNAKHNHVPKQISSNATNIGVHEMLSLQMKMIEDISGVHSAIQGQDSKSGTPSSLYAQQAQNATINTVDYMQSFGAFREMRDMKLLKVITQFYREQRYINVTGRTYSETAKLYRPELVEDLDFELTIEQGTDTPVYRNMIEDTLMKLLDVQAIGIEQYLQETSLPFADTLLKSIQGMKQQGMAGMPQLDASALPPEMQQQIQGANPQAMEMARQAITGQAMPRT